MNGGLCNVSPKLNGGVTTETHSNEADVAVPAELVGYPAIAMYPSFLFTPGTAITPGSPVDITDWTVEIKDDVDLIYPESVTGNYVDLNEVGSFQNWPLTAYISELGASPKLQLKNNVALLTPAAKYGYNFVAALVANNSALAGITIDADNLPELRITNVVLSSPDHKLTGVGHIENATTQNPYLVMDEPISGRDEMICYVWGNFGMEEGMNVIPSPVYPTLLGHVPVAPFANDGTEHLKVEVYFNITFGTTVYYFKYTGNEVEINQYNPIIRSERTTLSLDFYSEDPITAGKISAASTTPLFPAK